VPDGLIRTLEYTIGSPCIGSSRVGGKQESAFGAESTHSADEVAVFQERSNEGLLEKDCGSTAEDVLEGSTANRRQGRKVLVERLDHGDAHFVVGRVNVFPNRGDVGMRNAPREGVIDERVKAAEVVGRVLLVDRSIHLQHSTKRSANMFESGRSNQVSNKPGIL
jgi:hypothetical protein